MKPWPMKLQRKLNRSKTNAKTNWWKLYLLYARLKKRWVSLSRAIGSLGDDVLLCLDTLKSAELVIVKAMKNPPAGVKLVMEAVCVMLEKTPERKIDPSTQKPILDYWPTSVRLLADMDFRKVSFRRARSIMARLFFDRIFNRMTKTISNLKWSSRFAIVSPRILRFNRMKCRKCPLLAKVSANGS